ncbi:hypothetical protein TrispH2_003568 [Trichoplax sp. H2]|nr:hypothetical protein TrispH2_003568 [Trichoplax sp. H2]|eukprot:RDD45548.1 hypothetical protein TrispH2_003568 [Trichoplax sp. H2]
MELVPNEPSLIDSQDGHYPTVLALFISLKSYNSPSLATALYCTSASIFTRYGYVSDETMEQSSFNSAGKYGNVVLIRRNGTEGSKVPLIDKQSIFGSDDNCDIRIRNASVQNQHARVFIDTNNKAWIERLQPSAQIHVAGEALLQRQCRIKDGTKIKIGNKTFLYKKSDIIIDTPNKQDAVDDKENISGQGDSNTGILIPGLECQQQLSAKKLKQIRRRSFKLEESFVDDTDSKKQDQIDIVLTLRNDSLTSECKQQANIDSEINTLLSNDQLMKDHGDSKVSTSDQSMDDSFRLDGKIKNRRSRGRRSSTSFPANNTTAEKKTEQSNSQNNDGSANVRSKTPEKRILNDITSVDSLMKTVDEFFAPKRNRKSVTFGPHLSPELYSKKNPTDTPVKRGRKPVYTPMPSAGKVKSHSKRRSILKTPSVIALDEDEKESNSLVDIVSTLTFDSNDLVSLQESNHQDKAEDNIETRSSATTNHPNDNNSSQISMANSLDPELKFTAVSQNDDPCITKRRSFRTNIITRRHSAETSRRQKICDKSSVKRRSNAWVPTLCDKRSDDIMITGLWKKDTRKRRSSQQNKASQDICNDNNQDNDVPQSVPSEMENSTPDRCFAEAHHLIKDLFATPNTDKLNHQLIINNNVATSTEKMIQPNSTTETNNVCKTPINTPTNKRRSKSSMKKNSKTLYESSLSTLLNSSSSSSSTDEKNTPIEVNQQQCMTPAYEIGKAQQNPINLLMSTPTFVTPNGLIIEARSINQSNLSSVHDTNEDEYEGNTSQSQNQERVDIPTKVQGDIVSVQDDLQLGSISNLNKKECQFTTVDSDQPLIKPRRDSNHWIPTIGGRRGDDNLIAGTFRANTAKRSSFRSSSVNSINQDKYQNGSEYESASVDSLQESVPINNNDQAITEQLDNADKTTIAVNESKVQTTSEAIKSNNLLRNSIYNQTPVKTLPSDYDLEGLQNLFKTPKFRGKSSDENLLVLKEWLKTPKNQRDITMEPAYDGLQKLLKSSKIDRKISDEYLHVLKHWYKTPKGAKNPPLEPVVDGIRELFQTPIFSKNIASPMNEVTSLEISNSEETSYQMQTPAKTSFNENDVEGLQNLFKTPSLKHNSGNENLLVLKQWLKTPKSKRDPAMEPVYDGLQRLLKTPKLKSRFSDEYLSTLKQWFKTPRSVRNKSLEPVFDGLQQLFETPSSLKVADSAETEIKTTLDSEMTAMDTSNLEESIHLRQTPAKVSLEESNIEGLQDLFKTPAFNNSSRNENLSTLKQWLKTPKSKRDPSLKPVFDELQRLLKTPKLKSQFSDECLSVLKQWFKTPKGSKCTPLEPVFDGLQKLFETPSLLKIADSPEMEGKVVLTKVITPIDTTYSEESNDIMQTPAKVSLNESYIKGLQDPNETPKLNNNLCKENLQVLKQWLKTPKSKRDPAVEPMYDGLKRLLKTPKFKNQFSDEYLSTVKQWFKSPKRAENTSLEPIFDGLQQLFRTPSPVKFADSLEMDNNTILTNNETSMNLSNFEENSYVMQTPAKVSFEQGDIDGLQDLFKTPRFKNNSSDENLLVLKQWLKTPKSKRDPSLEPVYNELQRLLKTPKLKNQFSDEYLSVLKQWFKTPKRTKNTSLEPVFDDLQQLFETPSSLKVINSSERNIITTPTSEITVMDVSNSEENNIMQTPAKVSLEESNIEGLQVMNSPKRNIKTISTSEITAMDVSNSEENNIMQTPAKVSLEESNIEGLQDIFTTPRLKNNSCSENLLALKQWLKTPKSKRDPSLEPAYDGLQRLLKTPKLKSQFSDEYLSVLEQWFKTPKRAKNTSLEPVFDGLQQMFEMPSSHKIANSPETETVPIMQQDKNESINSVNADALNDGEITIYNLQDHLEPISDKSSEICEHAAAISEPLMAEMTCEHGPKVNEQEMNNQDEALKSLGYLLKTPRAKLSAQSIAERDNILFALKEIANTPRSKQGKGDVSKDQCLKGLKRLLKTPRSNKKSARYSVEVGLLPRLFTLPSGVHTSASQQETIYKGLKELFQLPKDSNETTNEFMTELADLFNSSTYISEHDQQNTVENTSPTSKTSTTADFIDTETHKGHVSLDTKRDEIVLSESKQINTSPKNVETATTLKNSTMRCKRAPKSTRSKATNSRRTSSRKVKSTNPDITNNVISSEDSTSTLIRTGGKRKINDAVTEEPRMKKLKKNNHKAKKRLYKSEQVEQKLWNNVVLMTPITELSESETSSCKKNDLSSPDIVAKGRKSKKVIRDTNKENKTNLIYDLGEVDHTSSTNIIDANHKNMTLDSDNTAAAVVENGKPTRISRKRKIVSTKKADSECSVTPDGKNVIDLEVRLENKTTKLTPKREAVKEGVSDHPTSTRNLRQKKLVEKEPEPVKRSNARATRTKSKILEQQTINKSIQSDQILPKKTRLARRKDENATEEGCKTTTETTSKESIQSEKVVSKRSRSARKINENISELASETNADEANAGNDEKINLCKDVDKQVEVNEEAPVNTVTSHAISTIAKEEDKVTAFVLPKRKSRKDSKSCDDSQDERQNRTSTRSSTVIKRETRSSTRSAAPNDSSSDNVTVDVIPASTTGRKSRRTQKKDNLRTSDTTHNSSEEGKPVLKATRKVKKLLTATKESSSMDNDSKSSNIDSADSQPGRSRRSRRLANKSVPLN